MRRLLEGIATGASGWIELRYHARRSKRLVVRNGQVEESSSVELVGVGVRAFVDGAFGFASTTDLTETGIRRAVGIAQDTAKTAAGAKKHRIEGIAKNGSDTDFGGLKVYVTAEDANGMLLGVGSAPLDPATLPARGTSNFVVIISDTQCTTDELNISCRFEY